jgi:hypothetical protein
VSGTASGSRQFGEGPLGRVTAFIYNLLVVELLFVAAVLPGLVPLALLDRDASNLPLFALCAVPAGPAVAAAVYTLHRRSRDLTDLHPAATFVRGYRINLGDALRVWVPLLAWLTVLGMVLAGFGSAGIPGWWAALLVVVAVGATLWGINALVIASLFTFRTRDLARLAGYFLARTPGVTVGNLCLLILAIAVIGFASEAALVLLAPIFVMFLVQTCRPMIIKVQEEFTA